MFRYTLAHHDTGKTRIIEIDDETGSDAFLEKALRVRKESLVDYKILMIEKTEEEDPDNQDWLPIFTAKA